MIFIFSNNYCLQLFAPALVVLQIFIDIGRNIDGSNLYLFDNLLMILSIDKYNEYTKFNVIIFCKYLEK